MFRSCLGYVDAAPAVADIVGAGVAKSATVGLGAGMRWDGAKWQNAVLTGNPQAPTATVVADLGAAPAITGASAIWIASGGAGQGYIGGRCDGVLGTWTNALIATATYSPCYGVTLSAIGNATGRLLRTQLLRGGV